ncbi:hypothetical protein BC943DRAFT_2051 [Umbelopsis sp. AD052]|nr:hypothetical protein BC943DRAFT_2051 [Umbelopsis sp. AD052]
MKSAFQKITNVVGRSGHTNQRYGIWLSPKCYGFNMVSLLSQSSVLPPFPQKGLSDEILGGSLISSNEIRANSKECSPLSFIYRYSPTALEVRDILLLQPVYALLTIHDLPTPDRHQLAIELATHGTMGGTLYIILLARDTHTRMPKLFMFDPRTLRCHVIYSSFNSKNPVTSISMSSIIPHQVRHKYISA